MLDIVSRDISSHLKLAMYDNTREGERAQNNNLEYSYKKKNGNLVRMNIIETASGHYFIIILLIMAFPSKNRNSSIFSMREFYYTTDILDVLGILIFRQEQHITLPEVTS